MSVASIFSFLFETQGAQKVTGELKNLTQAEEATKGAADKLTQSEDGLAKKNLQLAKSVSGLIGTYFGFKKILSEVFNFAGGGEDLLLMANNAGIGAEKLEQYGIALQNYGGGLSSAASTLSNLNQQMQDLRFGKGGAIQEAALRYGISVHGKNGLATGEEMLYNIARRMETLGHAEQLDLGRKLGLDPSTIALLQGGVENLTKELEKASKYSIYTPEDIENSRKFQMALRELKQSLGQVWATVSRALLPVITKIMNVVSRFFQFLADHKGFVLGFLAAISAALAVIAIKSIIATAPFWLMVLAIAAIGAAIGLLVDDFMTFLEGGESCIGDLIQLFVDFWHFLVGLGEKIGNFFKGIWENIIAGITGVFDWLLEKWNKIKKWIPFIGGKESDEMKVVEEGKLAVENTQTPLSSVTNISNNNTAQNMSKINNTGNNSVKIDSVIVQTQATDATGIAQGIGGALSGEMSDVIQQNTGGNVA